MSENLTLKQKKAVELLVTTGSTTETCRQMEITRQTIYRWLAEPTFRQALDLASSESLAELSRRLTGLGVLATDAIESVIQDEESSPGVKLRAAELILANILRLRELIDLENRITELEKKVKK